MKRHLQCADQQKSHDKFTKYCACHAKCISWLIRVTYETSFRMRGATTVTLQCHQILRLPRKMNLMIDPRHTWNVIYNARSKHNQPPTSPNTAPATKSVSSRFQQKLRERRFDDIPNTIRSQNRISHPPLRRPYSSDLEHDFVLKNTTFRAPAISQNVTKCCACHEKWHSNFTKYCACHAKCISWLIRVTYDTLFTMRGATTVTLQCHQILRLPRKMNLMIDPRHTWNVIYNARSKHNQPATSPNTAPATKSVSSRFQQKLRERRFDDIPNTIRSQNRISHPPLRRPYSSDLEHDFVLKNTTFRAPAISQNVTKCCACHEKWHSNFTKYCAWHENALYSSLLYSL